MTAYTVRFVWGRSEGMERDLAESKASALLRQCEEMEFSRRPRAEIWKVAVRAHAFAVLAQDRVLASNAGEIVARVRPPKSVAERRAIRDKAIAVLARLTPSRSPRRGNHHKTPAPWLSPLELRRVRAWLAREHERKRQR